VFSLLEFFNIRFHVLKKYYDRLPPNIAQLNIDLLSLKMLPEILEKIAEIKNDSNSCTIYASV